MTPARCLRCDAWQRHLRDVSGFIATEEEPIPGGGPTPLAQARRLLSRSLRDVCALVEDYFGNERYHLLSLCGMANTQSAAGRMVLMNLANYAQFEREMIS